MGQGRCRERGASRSSASCVPALDDHELWRLLGARASLPPFMLIPVTSDPLPLLSGDLDLESRAAQSAVRRVKLHFRSQNNLKARRLNQDEAAVEEPVHVASEQQASVLVMLANRRIRAQVSCLQHLQRRRPADRTCVGVSRD